jgi:hypothetical protein
MVHSLERHVAGERGAMAHPPCPFLNNALCSIYDVRPSVCRKAHSLDVNSCRGHAPELPQDLGVVVAAEALTKGTADAYRKLGFDARAYELGGAVLLALTDPTAELRWYRSEPLYVPDGGRHEPSSV